ncbi:hypothetical protein K1T71_010291 [Dendrolimus kikuchii]|uniref:Uncharacterized protein n=1 Tax=Dendrolimus kikuchii TaxID=765133 RepID=A0ACC1CRG8_9NEOP|nr:hypothetical protein K1T71_010291 [Dendrolimus kikuchii]
MLKKIIIILFLAFSGINGEPESVRENFDYLNDGAEDYIDQHLPKDDIVLRPQEVKNWPQESLKVGQITGVSINSLGQPVIFHRGERIWVYGSFNDSFYYQYLDQGPISEDTVLVLDPHTGSVLHSWGANTFYIPHGLTVDHHDNVWLTDVAKHQIYKYTPQNHEYPILTIGEAFTPGAPGNGRVLLCMPTAVAVATTGEIFVTDGYCNSHILKFNAAGKLLTMYEDSLNLNVPHSVTLLEHLDIVCVADRENMRIVCLRAGLKRFLTSSEPYALIKDPTLGRVYAVTSHGDTIYAVNGPTSETVAVRGFTVNAVSGKILDTWEASTGFTKPHAVAVTRNGSHLYVSEIGPNKIWKFVLTDVYDKK